MYGTLVLPADDVHKTAATNTTPTLQRRKTEMCGTLVMPSDDMTKAAATSSCAIESPKLGQDLKNSMNLRRRNTEMYGTLIMPAADDSITTNTSDVSPVLIKRRASSWYDPMNEVRERERESRSDD
jgi:hypothetical protein